MISTRDTGVDSRLLCPMSCPFLEHDRSIPHAAYCNRFDTILKVMLTSKPNTLDKIRALFNKKHSPVLKILIFKHEECEKEE